MIAITVDFYFVIFSKWDVLKCDHIKRLITLTSDHIKWLSVSMKPLKSDHTKRLIVVILNKGTTLLNK